ncbi:hypothetical protein SAMN06295967_110135 [Belliella buryatensis]|uniref:Lipocalin-like domain-containing protein n=1 Tax=Belliella buryatensis TaxID=1500549 RepID=A0A239EUF1_9BACT|nr:hypothetical protein [Belliella buryatensis]SNS48400.1 hypothetical protein SAMN06295967_110135 [Belliella buryatensis]
MKKGRIILQFLSLSTIVILFSCIDHESEATHSLIGDWEVNEVMITFGSSPSSQDSVLRFEGELGNFSFDSNNVQFSFLEGNFKQQGEDEYELTSSMERMGFNRVRKWQLKLSDREYEVEFDNRTRRSYVNANRITVIQQGVMLFPDIYSNLVLEMTKVE